MPELGRAALVAAFGLILYAAVVGAYAAWRGRRRLLDSATNALFAACGATGVAALALLAALAGRDFSFEYVARSPSRELPLPYTLAAFWSGQAGSLLLWLLVLTGAASAAILLNRRLVREVLPWTVPIVAGVAAFFAFLLVFVASPFATQAAPADGAGMNPSLQNPNMMIHPPMLYLGYVGLTIPFAFAMAALASRVVDERWIVVTRRWTLAAWTFLGFGILLGAKWAYEEVGWGGWYAWDPVENAALMPWLVATAYLHSVMVQEKKNMLRVWNVVLVALMFGLSLFGTFLTRSGVVNSIHSFTQSAIGPWFLGFIAVVAAASTALILWRLPVLRTRTRLESLVSREAAFLYNNLFLVALVAGVALVVAGAGSSPEGLIGYTFAAFVLAAIGLEFVRGTRARRSLSGGSWAGALAALIGRNRRRYGGYLVHAAVIVLLIGAVGIGAFASESSVRLRPGESIRAGGYTVSYL